MSRSRDRVQRHGGRRQGRLGIQLSLALRATPVYDQYDQVRDHIGDFVAHIEHDGCFRPGATQITAVGHSLGGGLAQLAAYADPKIRRVYAFDPPW